MVKILKLLPFLLLIACGKPKGNIAKLPNTIYYMDSTFRPYADQFLTDQFNYTGISVLRNETTLAFGNISEDRVLGECRISANGKRSIVIKKSFWDKSNYYDKLVLIYHELGHCIYDLDHVDGTIMNWSLISSSVNDYNIDYYKSEFFALVR